MPVLEPPTPPTFQTTFTEFLPITKRLSRFDLTVRVFEITLHFYLNLTCTFVYNFLEAFSLPVAYDNAYPIIGLFLTVSGLLQLF